MQIMWLSENNIMQIMWLSENNIMQILLFLQIFFAHFRAR